MASHAISPPLRVLYLANYAPLTGTHPISGETEGGKYSRYHQEMFEILESLGFKVTASRDIKKLLDDPSSYDYVFSLLNRAPYRGSEILVSALCEYFKLPYLGARPQVRAVAEDKYLAKIVARQLGFDVPRSQIYRANDSETPAPNFAGPYIAKLRCGASSKHITESCIQDLWEDLRPEVGRLLKLGDDVLVEEWIPGTNICLPVIGGAPPLMLPAYRLDSTRKGQLVTYEQKRGMDGGLKRNPFDDRVVYDQVSRGALTLYHELQPLDYMRLDFRVTDLNMPVFLEFNVCCNIGPQSGFYSCAMRLGLSHREMLTTILRHSFKRQEVDGQSL
jgi:D-alanine-D-alanine ligase